MIVTRSSFAREPLYGPGKANVQSLEHHMSSAKRLTSAPSLTTVGMRQIQTKVNKSRSVFLFTVRITAHDLGGQVRTGAFLATTTTSTTDNTVKAVSPSLKIKTQQGVRPQTM